MSGMLLQMSATLAGGATLSAAFNDLNSLIGFTTTGNVVTLSGFSGSKTITMTHGLLTATDLEYRKNGGAWTNCPTATGVSMASGDTLQFRLNAPPSTDSGEVLVRDTTGGVDLDRFDVSVT